MLSAARIEQLYPIKTGMDSPNTKISRGNWSLVVVRKFIAERIISYRNGNENSGILLTNRDFHLQTGNLDYKTGLSFTNGESWVTNGILSLLFTNYNINNGRSKPITAIFRRTRRKTDEEWIVMRNISNESTMTRQENERKCCSLEEVMVMLDVCRNTLMKLIRGNEFPYLKLGGVYRIPKESFDRWLDS